MTDLTPAQSAPRIATLLAAHESRSLEFKRISARHNRLYETMCAFANTEGGVIALGVGDAKALQPGEKPVQRLFGVEENPEGFDDLRRDLLTRFTPPLDGLHWLRLSCTLANGKPGHVVLLRVGKSAVVHSIAGDGTWTRMDASNRQMNAAEITDLTYQRGVKSAESFPVPVALSLLDTPAWRTYCATRGLADTNLAQRLPRLGLAEHEGDELKPRVAAVLLFADEPGALLAAQGMRADVRVFHYRGKTATHEQVPNLLLPSKTIAGPCVDQIARAQAYVLERLAAGLTMAGSGFKTNYRYPERVVKEAITNAVLHRDYRLNRDIHIRIFDDRIEIESPGRLPGKVTPATIEKAGSVPRNSLLARNLREFPNPPNVDAGEGVPMMFAQMAQANLYAPIYREQTSAAIPTLLVTLLNEERPPLWVQVDDWIDRNGPIANRQLREISDLDTLAASKQLRQWVAKGLLVALPAPSRQQAAYTKPELAGGADSFSLGLDNEPQES